MKNGRVHNFNAGPAAMPLPVLEEIRRDLLDWNGTGMSVMEVSHRSAEYAALEREVDADLRELMGIPERYKILFMQGGATLQFAAVPWNLMINGRAAYIDTGSWSSKAIKEARRYGEVEVAASGSADGYRKIPDCSQLEVAPDTDFVYICENETIGGLTWPEERKPRTSAPLVADQSSMFLSRPCDVSRYGLIYAGVQKNLGPAGIAIVIVREDLIRDVPDPKMPTYMRYDVQAANGSHYNTPNCWAAYCCGRVIKSLLRSGGLEAAHERNKKKADILYEFLDSSSTFTAPVERESRSLMNVVFTTGDKDLDAKIAKDAADVGIVGIKGHKSVGGLRASTYNAVSEESVEALVSFLKKYQTTQV